MSVRVLRVIYEEESGDDKEKPSDGITTPALGTQPGHDDEETVYRFRR